MPRYTLRCTCTDVPVSIREWLNHYGTGTLRETVITGDKAILRNWNKVRTIYCFCLFFALFLCKAVSPQTSVRSWKDFCPRGHSAGLAGEQCVRKHKYSHLSFYVQKTAAVEMQLDVKVHGELALKKTNRWAMQNILVLHARFTVLRTVLYCTDTCLALWLTSYLFLLCMWAMRCFWVVPPILTTKPTNPVTDAAWLAAPTVDSAALARLGANREA